jgi:type II secretory pathway pseudopilin PulG
MNKLKLNNEKGITLVEILASVTILSIILISLMGFFTQMGMMNKNNGDKTQAINTAKQVLLEWKDSSTLKNKLANANPSSVLSPEVEINSVKYNFSEDSTFFKFESTNTSTKLSIKVKKTPEVPNNPSSPYYSTSPYKLHYIHVMVQNEKKNQISETYGFIVR